MPPKKQVRQRLGLDKKAEVPQSAVGDFCQAMARSGRLTAGEVCQAAAAASSSMAASSGASSSAAALGPDVTRLASISKRSKKWQQGCLADLHRAVCTPTLVLSTGDYLEPQESAAHGQYHAGPANTRAPGSFGARGGRSNLVPGQAQPTRIPHRAPCMGGQLGVVTSSNH